MMPGRDRLDPIRLMCPPTPRALMELVSVPGPPISTMQSAPLPPVSFANLLVPVRGLGVIDHCHRAERLQPFGLFSGRSGGNHLSAQQPRQLQRENRDAAGPLGEHSVSGGYAAMTGQRYPRGHGSAR
jgi:hypothetical protein